MLSKYALYTRNKKLVINSQMQKKTNFLNCNDLIFPLKTLTFAISSCDFTYKLVIYRVTADYLKFCIK